MLVIGELVLREELRGVNFLLYWTACFFCVLLAIATALLDLTVVRRQGREIQRHLLEQSFRGIIANPENADDIPDSGPEGRREPGGSSEPRSSG